MNSSTRNILVLLALSISSLVFAGCANTGRGLKADTEKNLDKVEAEIKH